MNEYEILKAIAFLIASAKAIIQGLILLTVIQALVYRISNKKISLYNILLADLIVKEKGERI